LSSGGIPYPQWSPELALGLMDRHGIQTAVTSVSSPGVVFGNQQIATDLAHEINEYSATLIADHPKRFGAFGHIPLPDVDAALLELEYLSDTLKLDGVILLANIAGVYLGDPAFDPVYAELNRRKSVVFIHPTLHPSMEHVPLDLPEFMLEFTFDTTRAAANLVYSGTLERYPDIRFILAHAGGNTPYLAWRMSIATTIDPRLADRLPLEASEYLKRLYYDTALSPSPGALAALKALVHPSHILFGSDWPFAPEAVTEKSVQELDNSVELDAQLRADINTNNALALFPRLR
jgi:predicted TIM-barrel fold metal-dependent hydrolase